MERFYTPESLDARNALTIAKGLLAVREISEVVLDFSKTRQFEPFGLLVAGAALRDFSKQRGPAAVTRVDGVHAGCAAHEHMAHTGFFKWIGIPIGNNPGAVAGDTSWVPVTALKLTDLEQRMKETGKPLGDVVQAESERLARILTQQNVWKINAPLAYCFREVIRNVFEHAQTTGCTLCAQKWPDGRTEIAIIDQGRGIRNSLAEKYPFQSDAEALKQALKPGVSRNLCADPTNAWGNSGFGLYVLSEFGRTLGTFRAASGETCLFIQKQQLAEEEASFSGTAIQIIIKRPKGVNLEEYLNQIIERGEAHTSHTNGSRASLSTRRVV